MMLLVNTGYYVEFIETKPVLVLSYYYFCALKNAPLVEAGD